MRDEKNKIPAWKGGPGWPGKVVQAWPGKVVHPAGKVAWKGGPYAAARLAWKGGPYLVQPLGWRVGGVKLGEEENS
jgi:hypothetical protein